MNLKQIFIVRLYPVHSGSVQGTVAVLFAVLFFGTAVSEEQISFNRDIRPLLADRCFSCHGPDSGSREADLRLDQEEFAKTALQEGGALPIHPGKPEESLIFQWMTHPDPDELMPPPKSKISMTEAEISLLGKWIEQGAKWERHWAFIAPSAETGSEVAIDSYIDKKLEEAGLKPNEAAVVNALSNRAAIHRTVGFVSLFV